MRQLLSMGQREAVADLLNSAILKQADSKVTSGSRPQVCEPQGHKGTTW